jgi:hypothetical protein
MPRPIQDQSVISLTPEEEQTQPFETEDDFWELTDEQKEELKDAPFVDKILTTFIPIYKEAYDNRMREPFEDNITESAIKNRCHTHGLAAIARYCHKKGLTIN